MEIFGLNNEELIKAIKERHSVRSYLADKKIEPEKIQRVKDAIEQINSVNTALSFRLVTEEPRAFGGRWASYGNFKGVSNYIVIAGNKEKTVDFDCGRKGEELVLLIQHIGMNTCWVGLTYKKIEGAFEIGKNDSIRCVIAFGYGEDATGRSHKIKTPEQVSNIEESSPSWFKKGIEMALLAPTAVNQQKFFFKYMGEDTVKAIHRTSLIGYSRIDLGIAATHFLIGADNDKINLEIS